MTNGYKKIALLLVLSLIIGLMPSYDSTGVASVSFTILVGKTNYTKKTYKLTKGKSKTLGLNIKNSAGVFSTSFKSSKPSVATVTQNGKVKAKKVGTTKITVKIKGKVAKKSVSKSSWIKIKVVKASTATTATPTPTPALRGPMRAILIVNNASGSTSTAIKRFSLSILDTDSGKQLYDSLPKTIAFSDYDGTAKTASDDTIYKMDEYKPGTLENGDFMLYGQNRFYLFYKDAKLGYAYTRLGKVTDPAGLMDALGTGNASVTIIKDILPSAVPTATAKPSPSPSVSPNASALPSASLNPSASAGITPTGSASPTGSISPTGSAVPTATGSVSPAPTATTAPTVAPTATAYTYGGPQIRVTVVDAGQSFLLNVDPNNATAMRFFESLPRQMVMTPFNERRYMNDAYLSNTIENTNAVGQTRWSAGTLALLDNNRIFLFLKSETTSTDLVMATLGEFNKELNESTSFLTTAFPGTAVIVVFDKVK